MSKTNFILNSKREFLKFRIFLLLRSKKKLQLLLISKNISSSLFKFLYCLENEQFILPLSTYFSNTLSNRFFIPFFIHSLLFFIIIYSSYIHSQQLYFSIKKCYIHNIFRNTFTRITSKSYVENCYLF